MGWVYQTAAAVAEAKVEVRRRALVAEEELAAVVVALRLDDAEDDVVRLRTDQVVRNGEAADEGALVVLAVAGAVVVV